MKWGGSKGEKSVKDYSKVVNGETVAGREPDCGGMSVSSILHVLGLRCFGDIIQVES